MKKILFVYILLFILTGCSSTMEESQVETQQAGTEKITEIHAEAEHPFFEDFSYLYKASDVIITGVVKAKETNRINKSELGLIDAEDDYFVNITRYYIEIENVLKGTISETIIVDETGGMAEGINLIIDGAEYMEEGKQYLLLLRTPVAAKGKGYCENILVSFREGFYEYREGLYWPAEGNCLFREAFSMKDFESMIDSMEEGKKSE